VHDSISQAFTKEISKLAPLAMLFFGLFSLGSYWFGKMRGRLIDKQTGLESLRQTPWKQFEFLVAEAFRRQGYGVEFSLNRGADGGVDLVLRKDGRTSLVQCKRWKVFSVGPSVVREMFGLMTAEKAHEAVIVTTGRFTAEAQSFASGKPIRLIEGPQLLALVQSVQTGPHPSPKESPIPAPDAAAVPACPNCGKPMVIRTARRGRNSGNLFWGCKSFPACEGTRDK
jgi:restriction system protein